ncbi:bacillithiol system redox-active protein YtxJ [Aurantibacter crassamenti]|uniref:bacillithiol system redox-active protein YtxJ n=1 Tax=Aurantibacter crassamenti TaxID=1837375 RepID=UPI00193AAF40|nr:bacillithiol system redox-active protein YtxJ [Aurantibacter crassamenti]MBM1107458.1 bacillithiol system redox-active protein YtxJ [Aurantibacter crassamenti]
MGLFSGLFGNSTNENKEEEAFPWIELTELDQLEQIKEKSKTKTQLIFKHSTSCGISRMVIRSFKDSFDLPIEDADVYYLDLLRYREVSNEVGYKFQVMHQSPQLLIIKNGNAVANASHGSINDMNISEFI